MSRLDVSPPDPEPEVEDQVTDCHADEPAEGVQAAIDELYALALTADGAADWLKTRRQHWTPTLARLLTTAREARRAIVNHRQALAKGAAP